MCVCVSSISKTRHCTLWPKQSGVPSKRILNGHCTCNTNSSCSANVFVVELIVAAVVLAITNSNSKSIVMVNDDNNDGEVGGGGDDD